MTDTARVAPFPVPPVVKTITLRCPVDTAFERFTRDVHAWWPAASHSLGQAGVVHVGFEPHVGGRLFERAGDGTESTWGRVTAWEPPGRLVFTWHVGREPDTAQAVEVSFTPHAGGTRVQLVHWGWERLGDAAVAVRDEYDEGWDFVFAQRYAAFAGEGAAVPTQVVIVHVPGPRWRAGEPLSAQPGVQSHIEHYRALHAAGKLAAGGPFADARGGGMMIARPGVDVAELEAFAAADPSVQSGLLHYELRPWRRAMSGE